MGQRHLCTSLRAVAIVSVLCSYRAAHSQETVVETAEDLVIENPPLVEAPLNPREPVTDKTGALRMLAAAMRDNFEKIRSWQGSYSFQDIQLFEGDRAVEFLRMSGIDPASLSGSHVVLQKNGLIEFAVNCAQDALYIHMTVERVQLKDAGGNDVVIPQGKEDSNERVSFDCEQRSIVTPEHYLHFQPRLNYGRLEAAPALEPSSGRMAFRDAIEEAEGQQLGILVDPRMLFGDTQLFWDELELLASGLNDDELSEAHRELVDSGIRVFQHTAGDRTTFKTTVDVFAEVDAEPVVTISTVMDSLAGLNVVERDIRDTSGSLVQHISVSYRQYGDVYIPSDYLLFKPTSDGDRIRFQRNLNLRECRINEPIEDTAFTWANLGLSDGERVVDRIEEVIYLYEDGKLVRPVDFYAEPPSQIGPTGRWPLSVLFLANGLVLAAIVAFMFWRRRRSMQSTS